MTVAAADGEGEPLVGLHAADNAYFALLGFEDRALLDVQFEMGGDGHGFPRAGRRA